MPLVRMIISAKPTSDLDSKNAIVNTLYFNVSGSIEAPNYQSLVDDLWAIWAARPWIVGQTLDVRAYNMDDAVPRPQKARKVGNIAGSILGGPAQVALALSYYADRNLPRQRGRIFIGPWAATTRSASSTQRAAVIALPPLLADLGGLNVDWSLWSPTTGEHTRINHAWVDDSWDIIRSRKIAGTTRSTWEGNG